MLKILQKIGSEKLATVYIGETADGRIEFVESVQPPFKREEKWVLIVSSLYGCPIECEMCDAGGAYKGRVSVEDMLAQIDHMISSRYKGRNIPVKKLKIQFARMGEPSLNDNVLEVLRRLPSAYHIPCLIPSLSTIAPLGTDHFFEELLKIKNKYYPDSFQLQFSIHSTNEAERDRIIPAKKWGLSKISEYGTRFHESGGRKITLNFVLADSYKIDPDILMTTFRPATFLIKMTPLNPTCRADLKGLRSGIDANDPTGAKPEIAGELRQRGFEVLVSIGEPGENLIGSNCGQYIKTFEEYTQKNKIFKNSYSLSTPGHLKKISAEVEKTARRS